MDTAAAAESLLGREQELARIRRWLESAATGRAGLALEGEPGIGKTTLWLVGVESAREQDLVVLVARPAEGSASAPG